MSRNVLGYDENFVCTYEKLYLPILPGNNQEERGMNMFRMWGKLFHNNHMIRDTVIEDERSINRTQKVLDALDEIVYQFEIDSNVEEFKRFSKTRFSADHFIEEIAFDYLEIDMIEEDEFF